mmetsp:Transcript_18587/g.40243  ORF Transcript_18587/g.40243 Transcript_18587/m.40243 type:complete len:525 (+) Transcript_18587:102-1676(+)
MMAPTRRMSSALAAVVVLVATLSISTTDAFTLSPLQTQRGSSTSTTSLNQQQQQQQFFDASGNPVSMPMVYDANGNLVPFNPAAMQQQAQQPAAQQQQPAQPVIPTFDFEPNLPNALEPPLPPKTKAGGNGDPRPTGFNSDSYTMSNTADVYFAQLKQDSKVRKIARLSGDTERSNQVFADDSVKAIGDSFNQNPYTIEKNLAEARADIEGTVAMHHGASEFGDRIVDPNAAPSPSGISYKEKLEQMKAKRAGVGGGAAPAPVAVAVAGPPRRISAPPPPPPQVSMPVPPKVTQPMQSSPPVVAATPPAAVTPPPVSAMTAPADSEEDVRRKVRTLQGLLLKQRGGPGFGAGRLRAPEAQRLADTLEDVVGILRSEVGAKPSAPVVDAVFESKPVVTQPIAATPPPVRTMSAAPAVPIPAQPATPTPPPASTNAADPLAGSVACVEAVLNMYKNAPDSEKEGLMTPLRDALMAAASASNKNIAEGELDAHRAAMEAGPAAVAQPAVAAPMMGFPTSYAVTQPDE